MPFLIRSLFTAEMLVKQELNADCNLYDLQIVVCSPRLQHIGLAFQMA